MSIEGLIPLEPLSIRIPGTKPTLCLWWPSPARHNALKAFLEGIDSAQYATELNRSPSTVRTYLRECRIGCEVKQLRALAGQALKLGLITVEKLPAPDLPQDLAAVWAHLPADVPNDRLNGHIARATGLPRSTVDAALATLRSLGESDTTLIARGYACGIVTKQDVKQDVQPPLRPRRHRAESRHRSVPEPERRSSDPLGLLPEGMQEPCAGAYALADYLVTGHDVDVVRVSPDVCRSALDQLRGIRLQSGSVLGHIEGRVALFLLEPGRLPEGWRVPGGRLCHRGSTVRIPPAGGDSTAYWAMPYKGAYWQPDVLEELLDLPRAHTRR